MEPLHAMCGVSALDADNKMRICAKSLLALQVDRHMDRLTFALARMAVTPHLISTQLVNVPVAAAL